jgi:hypothetical protein
VACCCTPAATYAGDVVVGDLGPHYDPVAAMAATGGGVDRRGAPGAAGGR